MNVVRRVMDRLLGRRHRSSEPSPLLDPEPAIPPVVAGYRVLRTLARGDRADVLLGHPGPGTDGPPRALKLFRSSTPRDHIDAELVALARAQGPHVVQLVDVSTLRDGRVAAVLERVERDTLGAVLRVRGTLDLAEAVTILVPIAQAIDRLHADGVAHGSLSVSTIRFTERGSPTLMSFGVAELVDPGLPEVRLASVPGIAADRDALASIADAVLGRVGGAQAQPAELLLQRVRLAPPAQRTRVLVEGLFDLSDGAPVSFAPAADDADAASGSVVGPVFRRDSGATAAAVLGVIPDDLVTELLDGRPIRRFAGRVRRRSAPRATPRAAPQAARSALPRVASSRRRVAVAVAAGALTSVVVWVSIPAPQESDAAPAPVVETSPAVSVEADPSEDVAADDAAAEDTAAEDAVVGGAVTSDAVTGEDPGAAAVLLLAARVRCLRELDAACLDAVDQPDSSLHRSDLEWIRAMTAGEDVHDPLALDPMEIVGVQTLGDSAVVQLSGTTPASLLVMRGEAGWRIRELVAVTG